MEAIKLLITIIFAILAICFVFELYFVPFRVFEMRNLMKHIDKTLSDVLERLDSEQSIRADNGQVLSLLLGNMLEEKRKKEKDKT